MDRLAALVASASKPASSAHAEIKSSSGKKAGDKKRFTEVPSSSNKKQKKRQ